MADDAADLPLLTICERRYQHLQPPIGTPFEWTAERIEALRWMWEADLSTARIGDVLACGKAAVIGKAHRLHLPRKATQPGHLAAVPAEKIREGRQRQMAVEREAVQRQAAKARVAAVKQAAPQAVPAPVYQLTGGCRWPMWPNTANRQHEAYGRFCGGGRVPGRPYCPQHHRIAFTAAGNRKEDAA